jgi:predicted transcriptional regulator
MPGIHQRLKRTRPAGTAGIPGKPPPAGDLVVRPSLFRLTRFAGCLTLYDMKTNTLTIRLDKDLDELLTKASRRSGRNRSEIAREALRRQLRTSQFETLRQRIMPFAEARGYLTDEDVFADVS